MAKFEMIQLQKDDRPAYIETIEVRVWGSGGTEEQLFYLGSGLNYHASQNYWLEVICSANHVPFLYSRNFIHHIQSPDNRAELAALRTRLDKMDPKGENHFKIGDVLPETTLRLFFKKKTWYLEISLDTGSVFGQSMPDEHAVAIKIVDVELAEAVRFMRDLLDELDAAHQGRHPDPARFPEGSSEWPFVGQLNRQAYDQISSIYEEQYFENPLLTEKL